MQALKAGIVVSINEQEELNLLASVTGNFEIDSIIVSEPMVAYSDEIGAVWVVPLEDFASSFPGVKPRKFKSWYRKYGRKSNRDF